jgi:hypothetical protein
MAVNLQVLAHTFCIAPMMDGNDNLKIWSVVRAAYAVMDCGTVHIVATIGREDFPPV